jgi:hypothetical protein
MVESPPLGEDTQNIIESVLQDTILFTVNLNSVGLVAHAEIIDVETRMMIIIIVVMGRSIMILFSIKGRVIIDQQETNGRERIYTEI